jgi:hypothetical protein
MAYVSDDRNYTDPENSGNDAADRAGLESASPANEPVDRNKAAKMANLLEDLVFPATKEEIKNHINRKSPGMGNRVNDVFEAVWNDLDENKTYNSVYEIEKAAGLVRPSG